MNANLLFRKIFSLTIAISISLFVCTEAKSQTYTTIANGAWSSAATWQGGNIPNASNIPLTAVINIKHIVTYSGSNILNAGTINIYNPSGISPKLIIAGGINFSNSLTGKLLITGGEYRQYRFTNGGESGTAQTGSFTNTGGLVQVKSSYVEVAQDWINQTAGIVSLKNSSLVTGGQYDNKALAIDTLLNTSVSVGWQGNGDFTEEGLSAYFQALRVEVASSNGNFALKSGLINGNINFITLKNHVTGVYSSAKISATGGITTTGLTLDAYCLNNSNNYKPGSAIKGSQTASCTQNYFPATLSGASAPARMNFSLTPSLISGTDKNAGAKYKYESIAPGMDAIVSIDSLINGATVNSIDDNSGGVGFIESFQPQVTSGPSTGNSYAVFTISYQVTGTSTPYVLDTLNVTALDIDGNAGLKEFDQISAGTGSTAGFIASNPSITLTQVAPGTFRGINKDAVERSGIDTSALSNMFTVKNTNASSFSLALGFSTSQAQQSLRQFSIYMKGFNYPVASTLPVKLESFTAALDNSGVKVNLSWITASEQNLSHFVVERSTDGANFTDAGIVFAAENSTIENSYAFRDAINNIQSDIIYYRLNSVDLDGKHEYSETRIIRVAKQTTNAVTVTTYPNPATNELHITLPNSWQNKSVVFELSNMNGQPVISTTHAHVDQTETISISTLSRGVYFVKINCEGQTAIQKIVKF